MFSCIYSSGLSCHVDCTLCALENHTRGPDEGIGIIKYAPMFQASSLGSRTPQKSQIEFEYFLPNFPTAQKITLC